MWLSDDDEQNMQILDVMRRDVRHEDHAPVRRKRAPVLRAAIGAIVASLRSVLGRGNQPVPGKPPYLSGVRFLSTLVQPCDVAHHSVLGARRCVTSHGCTKILRKFADFECLSLQLFPGPTCGASSTVDIRALCLCFVFQASESSFICSIRSWTESPDMADAPTAAVQRCTTVALLRSYRPQLNPETQPSTLPSPNWRQL